MSTAHCNLGDGPRCLSTLSFAILRDECGGCMLCRDEKEPESLRLDVQFDQLLFIGVDTLWRSHPLDAKWTHVSIRRRPAVEVGYCGVGVFIEWHHFSTDRSDWSMFDHVWR